MLLPAALLLVMPALALQDEAELLSEALPGGGLVEREVERGPAGEAINHGTYKSWWDAERREPREAGRYEHGRKRATWRTYYPGKQRESKGKYEDGLRVGAWSYWRPDGEQDVERSGEFAVQVQTHENGALSGRGEVKDGLRHGTWSLYWPNGVTLAEGAYRDDRLTGTWVLHHPDGTPDPDWVSGEYIRGVRVRGLSEEQRRLALAPGQSAAAVEAALVGPVLIAGEEADVLGIVRNLLRLDLNDAEAVAIGTRLVGLLAEATGGARFEWRTGASPEDAAANRLSILRWASFWTLLALNHDFANFDYPREVARLAPIGERIPLEALHPPFGRPRPSPALQAFGALAPRFERSTGSRSNKRSKSGAVETGEALAAALDWLARHQAWNGSWSGARFAEQCPAADADGQDVASAESCGGAGAEHNDVGLTALCVLALLGDGNTTLQGPHQRAVERGLAWLLARQDPATGRFGELRGYSWVYSHAIATLVMAEAAMLSGSETLLDSAQRAVDWIERTRNPYGAWRYAAAPDGENDTSVTGWMVQALVAARQAGLVVDDAALQGALGWIDEVTEVSTGRCGYDRPGSASARIEDRNEQFPTDRAEAMTGVALFARFLLGQRPAAEGILLAHADLIRRRPPEWDPEGLGCDMYAWYYSSYAQFQMGGEHWSGWWKALTAAALPAQRDEGHLAGSWDPVGPWGFTGGRVYSTALMALCLEAPHRLARLSELDEER